MSADLVALAERFVALSGDIEAKGLLLNETRDAMRRLLTANGEDIPAHPPRPAGAPGGKRRPHKGKPSEAEVEAAERQVLAALSDSPGATSAAIARTCGKPENSTAQRLHRLASRGLIQRAADGLWSLTAS